MKSPSSSAGLLLSALFLLTFFSITTAQTPKTFKCNSTSKCQSLIDYVPINATTYSNVKTLFGVKNLRLIFGANSLPLSTSPNEPIPAKQHIKVPFPCICNNGTGISNKRPVYKVKDGDGLDFIARTIFSNLMTYQQIAAVNKIPNPDKIEVGQELVIPLPCSCDEVDEMEVVHYGHVVRAGSTVKQIADEYGTTESTLLRLNDLASPNDLMADSVLDVPLQACTSAISNTSLDYPLLVPNGTYTFTANNCVQCKCDKANNWTLQCDPSPEGTRTPKQCPAMQCPGPAGFLLGNTSSSSCGRTTCSYAGYTNATNILTTVVGDSACISDGAARPSENGAANIGLRRWSWVIVSFGLGLVGSGVFW